MRNRKPYIPCISAATMLLLLFWLTISAPFIYIQQEQLTTSHSVEEASSTPANSEEKSSAGISGLSEYLHEQDRMIRASFLIAENQKYHTAGIHIDFHPELSSPPPEACC